MGHNGGMYVSAEVISIIFAAAGVLITLGGGFFAGLAWLLRRMDERFDKVDVRFDKVDVRFDKVDERFDRVYERFHKVDERFDKVDERFNKMDERIGQLQAELNDVKVAVARLEGPHQRLIFPR
ncbi:MAG TPA: response regulator [Candidatus Yaniella excrementigallinarum]|nr:response regulator [Candidatus Yaniella excrementigallinarum]